MEECAVTQQALRELFLTFIEDTLKQIVITVVISMKRICERPLVMFVMAVD